MSVFLILLLLSFQIIFVIMSSNATIFKIHNQCHYTIWAAATPGGGRQLNANQSWIINFKPNRPQTGLIWGRTLCKFNKDGRGSCKTGDCDGLLQCKLPGSPPYTLGQYSLYQHNNVDSFNLSLVNGFNLNMDFTASIPGSRGLRCRADVSNQCPPELRVPGGCTDACTQFQTEKYCCRGSGKCEDSYYSSFFKKNCPDAYSYRFDQDPAIALSYPSGTNYQVIFCPREGFVSERECDPKYQCRTTKGPRN